MRCLVCTPALDVPLKDTIKGRSLGKTMAKATITMDDLLADEKIGSLTMGEIVDGTVLSLKKHEALIDLGAHGVGLVPRREIGFNRNIKEGDEVTASVIEPELETGYSLLSLRKAAKDKGWDDVIIAKEEGAILDVKPYDANRGGLLIEFEGVRGFLPVSQLSAEHYPRVGSSDKDEILQRLNALAQETLKVIILDADKKANKLIFSEKEAVRDGLAERFEKLAIGDKISGVVTGVVDFGVFVNVDGIEGLIHISEISWERVNDPKEYVKVGQEIEAKIIAIDKDRLSLSMKQLSEDPWMSEVEKFKKGDNVEGTVTRITPFGAFVQISPAVEALIHVSELGKDSVDPEKIFTLNERKDFVVLEVDKENRKISLGLTK
jgi:small subunit ribosomal protein S1